ncbi:hypothetical protein DMUE_3356 [Dictyocoela muelleri]|nr:hypothetical protein DMUE_3356 [Dictyocoela muelleri]
MIVLIITKILCASNFDEEMTRQNNSVENITTSNSDMNPNLRSTDFNHTFAKTQTGNNKFNIEMLQNTNDLCLQNFDSSGISSNFRSNKDKIYASKTHSQAKISADNPTTDDYTKHNEYPIYLYKEPAPIQYNFCKSINQTSANGNISSNNYLNFESQNNHDNINEVWDENKLYQSASNDNNNEKHTDTSKYPQNDEILQDQSFDYLDLYISQFDEIVKNDDLLEIQRNFEFDEIFKLIERDQELIKEENEILKQNIIPPKRTRIEMNLNFNNSNYNNSNVKTPIIEINDMITSQKEVLNNNSNFQKLNTSLKTGHKPITPNIKNKINIKENKTISQPEVYRQSLLNTIPIIFSETNKLSNISSTSKTDQSSKNHEINSTCDNENNSPYGNDFDSPNFSLDFLNSYMTELNEKYLEQCENIFSVVIERINRILSQEEYVEKFSNSKNNKNSFKYRCYLKINITVKYLLKEILGEEIPISICANIFINLYDGNLDIGKSKHAKYNIFRTNEHENNSFNSLISNIENNYGNEANKMAKSAYDNFLEKLNPYISVLIKEIYDGHINNKNELYSNINKVFYDINNLIFFKNYQITESESLIIYKVLKSISKFLKKISEDQYLTQVFPEFRIINILYHLRIKDHHIYNRKFHAGIFLKKILKQKLNEFKEKYQSVQNLDDTYFKEILEIRVFYIFNLFKFLNIKKPYLLGYIFLSIKAYLLHNEQASYKEKNDLEKIFSLHLLKLDKILNQEVFIRINPTINKI